MIVVDASLAVKWLIGEPDSREANIFFDTHQDRLVAPDLLLTEVAGALVRRGNADKTLAADALLGVESWTAAWSEELLRVEPVTPELVLHASGIALRLGHPLKDCIYLAVAVELGAELATCDVKFRDRAAPLFENVRLLSDYGF